MISSPLEVGDDGTGAGAVRVATLKDALAGTPNSKHREDDDDFDDFASDADDGSALNKSITLTPDASPAPVWVEPSVLNTKSGSSKSHSSQPPASAAASVKATHVISAPIPAVPPTPVPPQQQSSRHEPDIHAHAHHQTLKVLYDYDAAEEGELTLHAGDIVYLLEPEDDQGWCQGKLQDGTVGFFPTGYAEEV